MPYVKDGTNGIRRSISSVACWWFALPLGLATCAANMNGRMLPRQEWQKVLSVIAPPVRALYLALQCLMIFKCACTTNTWQITSACWVLSIRKRWQSGVLFSHYLPLWWGMWTSMWASAGSHSLLIEGYRLWCRKKRPQFCPQEFQGFPHALEVRVVFRC